MFTLSNLKKLMSYKGTLPITPCNELSKSNNFNLVLQNTVKHMCIAFYVKMYQNCLILGQNFYSFGQNFRYFRPNLSN